MRPKNIKYFLIELSEINQKQFFIIELTDTNFSYYHIETFWKPLIIYWNNYFI